MTKTQIKQEYVRRMPGSFLKLMGKTVLKKNYNDYKVNGVRMDWQTLQNTARKVYLDRMR